MRARAGKWFYGNKRRVRWTLCSRRWHQGDFDPCSHGNQGENKPLIKNRTPDYIEAVSLLNAINFSTIPKQVMWELCLFFQFSAAGVVSRRNLRSRTLGFAFLSAEMRPIIIINMYTSRQHWNFMKCLLLAKTGCLVDLVSYIALANNAERRFCFTWWNSQHVCKSTVSCAVKYLIAENNTYTGNTQCREDVKCEK